MKRRTFTDEFKAEAVAYVLEENQPVTRVAKRLGIGQTNLSRWVKEFQSRTHSTPTPTTLDEKDRRIAELEKQLRKADMEREILKKAMGFLAKE